MPRPRPVTSGAVNGRVSVDEQMTVGEQVTGSEQLGVDLGVADADARPGVGAGPVPGAVPMAVPMPGAHRALLAGWFSFRDGEATAGDVLAWRAVHDELERAGIDHDTAWSPMFRPDALTLDDAVPDHYSHLVFVCGPVHGGQIAWLTDRFASCRRIAVGVSVVDPADAVLEGFDVLIPRDMPGLAPQVDLAARPAAGLTRVPVVGVVLTDGQGEYGPARRHESVRATITDWLGSGDVAALPLDTRLDKADWTLSQRPEQFVSILDRLDAVVSTRLHGLVIALANAVPVVAVDPVSGGGKVTAQARAWGWPAVLEADGTDAAALDAALAWCRSADGRDRARIVAERLSNQQARTGELLTRLRREFSA